MHYSLNVLSPIIQTSLASSFVVDLTPDYMDKNKPMVARGWRRSIRGIGGYWQGEFTLYGDVLDLSQFFYERLAYHIEERSAGHKTWEGLVYEMELTTDGVTRRRTLDNLYNHVRVKYRNSNNEVAVTDAVTDDNSIDVYGQREQIWPLDGQDTAAAEAARDYILADYSWPRARTTGTMLGTVGGASLLVRTCGYIFTANWQYESAGNNTQDELSDWIILIVQTDCPFLKMGRVERNTTQVWKETRLDMRSWDVITKLLELGSTTFQPTRAYVDNERSFNYETIATAPMYFKRGGGFYSSTGTNVEVNPFEVRPAVVRDLSYPVKKTELGAWLSDARDWYMAEVDVWDNGDGTYKLVPKSDDYEESDILTAQEAYKNQLKRLKEQKKQDKK